LGWLGEGHPVENETDPYPQADEREEGIGSSDKTRVSLPIPSELWGKEKRLGLRKRSKKEIECLLLRGPFSKIS
jgi:hypothetical protein